MNWRVWFLRDTGLPHPEKLKGHRETKTTKKDPFSLEPLAAQDNDHVSSEIQSCSLGRRNIHADHSLIQECGIFSNRHTRKTSLMSVAKHWWHKMHIRRKSDLQIHWSGHSNARNSTSEQHFMPFPGDCAFWFKRCFLEMLIPRLILQRKVATLQVHEEMDFCTLFVCLLFLK